MYVLSHQNGENGKWVTHGYPTQQRSKELDGYKQRKTTPSSHYASFAAFAASNIIDLAHALPLSTTDQKIGPKDMQKNAIAYDCLMVMHSFQFLSYCGCTYKITQLPVVVYSGLDEIVYRPMIRKWKCIDCG